MNSEQNRIDEARQSGVPWRKWGPYLSERQWGTVREDYSEGGDAWSYFTHDQARSRAYRRGEDGLAGFSDEKQRLCFALALWNGKDPILKERLFGLSNTDGNHGEDVKEYYYYLDATPTHSYMQYLYKYPHAEFPYDKLLRTNKRRDRKEPEFELVDTGVFERNRYFDVFVEYAKDTPEDILIRITAVNRGDHTAELWVLPTLWFRNTWSWGPASTRPVMTAADGPAGKSVLASHEILGQRRLHVSGDPQLLFTDNETNNVRIFDKPNTAQFLKDGIDEYLIAGQSNAVNPEFTGTKAAMCYALKLQAGESTQIRLRLRDAALGGVELPFGAAFDALFRTRKREADEFYESITPKATSQEDRRIIRQAMAGMLWSKQYYFFNVHDWLAEHGVDPSRPSPGRKNRNADWSHMVNDHVISMPDKWEYPWYAAWDLAFHTVALAMADLDFAKEQLDLMLGELYLHPSGQMPAYEWDFSSVNPPVHAWASIFIYRSEQNRHGKGDLKFLERIFNKLQLNFSWWVNRKDRLGINVFEGGFLGVDDVGIFDRNVPLPTGGHLEQADGTAWMCLFCQNMFELCVELTARDPLYDPLAAKFGDHLLWIGASLNGANGMWDEEDGFYYDLVRFPDGSSQRLRVRSIIGLLPMCAATIIEPWQRDRMPNLSEHMQKRLRALPKLFETIHPLGEKHRSRFDRGLLSMVDEKKLRRILSRMLDESEFLSPYGIRSISRYHLDHPYDFRADGREFSIGYLPGESDSGLFGGNSNWRGPVWLPINAVITRALMHYYLYYGDDFQIECPTGSGKMMNLFEVARELARRQANIFRRDEKGRRPVFGANEKFQTDPHFRDHLLFYEYFHGDNGAGIGASHQTGWSALVARQIELFHAIDPQAFLKNGLAGAGR